jgi:hypothetical protein
MRTLIAFLLALVGALAIAGHATSAQSYGPCSPYNWAQALSIYRTLPQADNFEKSDSLGAMQSVIEGQQHNCWYEYGTVYSSEGVPWVQSQCPNPSFPCFDGKQFDWMGTFLEQRAG